MSSAGIPEVSLDEAWAMLEADPRAVLLDVRTQAEWQFVGVPSVAPLTNEVRLVEWTTYPSGQPNPAFLDQASSGLETDQPIVVICRSGARSLSAARVLEQSGFSRLANVSAGFEGDTDAEGHRRGGWKEFLPWRQG